MKHICLYFQVHQPFRLKKYSFFHINSDEPYFDEESNRNIIRRISTHCYLPFNRLLLKLIRQNKERFKVSFSISGTAIEQFRMYAPETLDSFIALAETGQVELLAETYAHSLACISDVSEFKAQVNRHREEISTIFGQYPQTFRNTELIYADKIAELVDGMGFHTILAEAAPQVMDWRSADYVYAAAHCPNLKVLLKNHRLSDDIAFRFNDHQWKEWPLSVPKFISWIKAIPAEHQLLNLFMDYETFGEHLSAATGIFDFFTSFVRNALRNDMTFITPAGAAGMFKDVGELVVPDYTSWADSERDLSAWLGNDMQRDAFDNLYKLKNKVMAADNAEIMECWTRLQASDHFYYMSTKGFSDGAVHSYFSPYTSPFDAFINYMNVLTDFSLKIDAGLAGPGCAQPAVL
jgi:alpha-amylase